MHRRASPEEEDLPRWARWLRALLWLAAWACASRAHAIPAELPLDQLHHTRWTAEDGAPAGARIMAQTTDGALWMGTESGLYRFDGVQFERMRAGGRDGAPLGYVSALLAMPHGGLWVGMGYGGLYHWQAGRFTAHGPADGLPGDRTVRGLVQDMDDRLWAGTSEGLFVRQDGRWRRAGAGIGHPDGYILELLVDPAGSLWIAGTEGVYRLPRGGTRVERHLDGSSLIDLVARPDGSVWVSRGGSSSQGGELRPVRPAPGQAADTGMRYPVGDVAYRMLADRDGGVWAPYGEQLMRLPDPAALRFGPAGRAPPQAQRFGVSQGLSGVTVYYVFEDREGSVWVSTDQGLDRFKRPRVRAAGSAPGESRLADTALGDSGLSVADDGGPLLCSIAAGVLTMRGPVAALAPAGTSCEAIDREPSGRRWLSIDLGVWWWHQGKAGRLKLPPDVQPVLAIPALKMDTTGTLWVSFMRKGLYRYRDGRWTWVEPGRNGFPAARPISMGRDAAGRVWLGYPGSRIAMAEGEGARNWGPAQGLQVGEVHMIQAYGDAMLIGGSDGLALLAEGRVTPLQGAGGERFEGVGAIVEAGDGSWWVHAGNTVSRLPASELARARREPGHRLAVERFGAPDGLRGIAPPGAPWPSAVRTQDGRLWLSTSTRLYTLHPERIERNPRPPVVELRGLQVEGKEAELVDGQQLPVGTHRLELRYAALHIGAPERVRYRYRLDGVDPDWQHTAARSATYTNLAPGDYTFRVSAANEDGVWNETGVSTRLTIPPAFHQTAWFYALCAAAALALAWGAYRLRIRQLGTRLRLRAEARTEERERIARDLHDTLLQSTQGLVLMLQAVATRLPDEARDRVASALVHTEQVMAEGRARVQDLRSADDAVPPADLAERLARCAAGLALTHSPAPALDLQVRGPVRPLAPAALDAALQVGSEALRNAHAHARASTVQVVLDCGDEAFRLTVHDNGRGLEAARLGKGNGDGNGHSEGHWGVIGMHERAREAGGTLLLDSDAGGTRVVLTLPAARAYAQARRG